MIRVAWAGDTPSWIPATREESIGAHLVFGVDELGDDAVAARNHLQILAEIHAQIVAVPRESSPHRPPARLRREPRRVGEVPAGIDGVGEHVLELVVLDVADHRVAVRVAQQAQSAGLRWRRLPARYLLVGTALDACADHVRVLLERERGDAGHGVEVDGVGVLEEEHAVEVVALQPRGDHAVLPGSPAKKLRGTGRSARRRARGAS